MALINKCTCTTDRNTYVIIHKYALPNSIQHLLTANIILVSMPSTSVNYMSYERMCNLMVCVCVYTYTYIYTYLCDANKSTHSIVASSHPFNYILQATTCEDRSTAGSSGRELQLQSHIESVIGTLSSLTTTIFEVKIGSCA